MGKISPTDIFEETFANAFRQIRLFFPVALAVAVISALLNQYAIEQMFSGVEGQAPGIPPNFWTTWALLMLGTFALQALQMSLFDAVMEQRTDWLAFGIARVARRLLPVIVGVILLILLYGLGIVLLIVPGIMVIVLLYMMMPLVLLDGVGPFAAVGQSWRLTWGNAWRLVGAMFLVFLPVMLCFSVAVFALGVMDTERVQTTMQPALAWADWKTWTWVVLMTCMGLFATSFYLVAFRALKAAKAGAEAELPVDVVSA